MELPSLYKIYAVCFSSIFLIFFIKAFMSWRGVRNFLLVARNKRYLRLVRRHRLVGPYYLLRVILYITYVGINVVSLCLNIRLTKSAAPSVSFAALNGVASRAGYLALINLAPIYLSPHGYGLADLFGISIGLHQRMHRATGGMSIALCLLHTAMAIIQRPPAASSSLIGVYKIMVSQLLLEA
jgi:hypothetical protein